jgi:eukaryotic-like serine/threonine-protein kinase
MALAAGTKLGSYEIIALLGAGGMGEVYRARDTRLQRMVAIKTLSAHLSTNPEARERFDREARTISSLNHPNICHLYDIGQQDGITYLVMEYLEGETLGDRLRKGPLPLDQALRTAGQICQGLEKAHSSGVIHRDLKPSNIMLTKTGAKLLDFGLAKPATVAVGASSSSSSATATLSQPLTSEGFVAGTFQYMSPEQVEGKELDVRSDLFSLGAVLYEMVTGKRAFEGKTTASTIAAILASEPEPISDLRPLSPPLLEHVVKACLKKDAAERWQSAGDLATALGWISEYSSAAVPTKQPRGLFWSLVGLALVLVLTLLSFVIFRQKAHPAHAVRFSFAPPDRTSMGTFMAFAPDGSTLAFVGTSRDGKDQIWLRRLNAASAELLSGTDGASFPFWSPDSRYLGFFAERKLKVLAATGGPARTLCEVIDGRGASWGSQNIIVFSPHWQGGLEQISANGGEVRPATKVEEGQDSHRVPTFLPDGNHFVYYAMGTNSARTGLYIGSLDGKQGIRLGDADSFADYADPGLLVFVKDNRLLEQSVDERSLRLVGDPTPLADSIIYDVDFPQSSAFAVARTGSIAYRTAEVSGNELVWFDRKGKRLGTLAKPDNYAEPALSHDGRYVAVQRGRDVILISVATGATSRFAGGAYGPTWSPDDKRIIFSHLESGSSDIYLQELGAGSAQLLLHSNATKNMEDWSSDGRYIVWGNTDSQSQTGSDVYTMRLDGKNEPTPILSTPYEEGSARFSPDGKWIAYTSDESGRNEVYVQPFPSGGNKVPISVGGGTEPYWRADEKEIFYLAADRKLMAVSLKAVGPEKLEAALPVVLFQTVVPGLLDARSHYVPTPDGKRFLVVADLPETQNAPVNVVVNYTAELKSK